MVFIKGYVPWNKGLKWKCISKRGRHSNPETEFKKECVPWNKNLKGYKIHTEEYKKTLVKMMRKNNPMKKTESRNKLCGINHYNWKGGITLGDRQERIRFRRTIQKVVLDRDNYTCQMCGARGVNLQIDHIQSWSKYPDLRFDVNNCRTLCKDCHYKITFGRDIGIKNKPWGHNFKHLVI